eukprot:UN01401
MCIYVQLVITTPIYQVLQHLSNIYIHHYLIHLLKFHSQGTIFHLSHLVRLIRLNQEHLQHRILLN